MRASLKARAALTTILGGIIGACSGQDYHNARTGVAVEQYSANAAATTVPQNAPVVVSPAPNGNPVTMPAAASATASVTAKSSPDPGDASPVDPLASKGPTPPITSPSAPPPVVAELDVTKFNPAPLLFNGKRLSAMSRCSYGGAGTTDCTNSVQYLNTFDNAGRLTQLVRRSASDQTVIGTELFTWDDAGLLVKYTSTNAVTSYSEQLSYDTNQHLISRTTPNGVPNQIDTYEYLNGDTFIRETSRVQDPKTQAVSVVGMREWDLSSRTEKNWRSCAVLSGSQHLCSADGSLVYVSTQKFVFMTYVANAVDQSVALPLTMQSIMIPPGIARVGAIGATTEAGPSGYTAASVPYTCALTDEHSLSCNSPINWLGTFNNHSVGSAGELLAETGTVVKAQVSGRVCYLVAMSQRLFSGAQRDLQLNSESQMTRSTLTAANGAEIERLVYNYDASGVLPLTSYVYEQGKISESSTYSYIDAPDSLQALTDLLNSLPKPLTLPSFLSSLQHPLAVHATLSKQSAQPAVDSSNPRIFIQFGTLVMSVVPEGPNSQRLEIGVQTKIGPANPTFSSEMAAISFPVAKQITVAALKQSILSPSGVPSCFGCHQGTQPIASAATGASFPMIGLRPALGLDMIYSDLTSLAASCTDHSDRCAILRSIFDLGSDAFDFPDDMAHL